PLASERYRVQVTIGVATQQKLRRAQDLLRREIPDGDPGAIFDRRCAFRAANGRRRTERVFLEFHHREPYAIGGEATVANISLRCRAHNVYEAVPAFGLSDMSSPRGELRPESSA